MEYSPSKESTEKEQVLSVEEIIRYGRQISYPGFGETGQDRLRTSHALVVGAGGLGCAASMYLAYAGFGHITIVDDDSVELSNLNRQLLHWENDVGMMKTVSAEDKLHRINSSIEITSICEKVTEENVDRIVKGSDVVIDALDNFENRFVINEACVGNRVPLIHAGVSGLLGQVTTIIPGKTPCLACIYSAPPASEEKAPVFVVTPALIASLQVMEAIKLIAGFGETLEGRMLYFNVEIMESACEDLVRDPECVVCKDIMFDIGENGT